MTSRDEGEEREGMTSTKNKNKNHQVEVNQYSTGLVHLKFKKLKNET
jgi:hypothetical protein